MQLALQFVDFTIYRLDLTFQLVHDAGGALMLAFCGRGVVALRFQFVEGGVLLISSVVFVVPRPGHPLRRQRLVGLERGLSHVIASPQHRVG